MERNRERIYGNRDFVGRDDAMNGLFSEEESPDTGGSSGSGSPENSRDSPHKESPVEEVWRRNEEEKEEYMKRKSEEPSWLEKEMFGDE
eukprot:387202-Karenia_brevis.AAC.1